MTGISAASCYWNRDAWTYTDGVILETLSEGLSNRLVVLLLDNAGSGVEDAERRFPLARVFCYAQLEEHGEQLWPWLVCT